LGSFPDDTNWYIQVFSTVFQTFKLACKDVILLLNQTVTFLECQRVLDQTTQEGNDYHLKMSFVKLTPLEVEDRVPIVQSGAQDVLRTDSGWDPRT
jgi:hypothetical protein